MAATDYMKVVADQIAPWLAGRMETLGTDGFGRSGNREYLRRHFDINAESIAATAPPRVAFAAGLAAAERLKGETRAMKASRKALKAFRNSEPFW